MNIAFTELPKNKMLRFEYHFFKTLAGEMLIVSWEKNLVYAAFASNRKKALKEVQDRFSGAKLIKKKNRVQERILEYFIHPKKVLKAISVAVSGTPFQVAVWKMLLKAPFGKTLTYSDLARKLRKPSAVRAVASAVANNPIALLIPCHRVVPKSGGMGKYHWGAQRKKQLLAFESSNK